MNADSIDITQAVAISAISPSLLAILHASEDMMSVVILHAVVFIMFFSNHIISKATLRKQEF